MQEFIPLSHIITVSTAMFFIGIYGFIKRQNLFMVLMAIELMLNGVAINFVAINYYMYPENLQGHFFTLFVIGVAAAEASLAIALIVNIYRKIETVNTESINQMKY